MRWAAPEEASRRHTLGRGKGFSGSKSLIFLLQKTHRFIYYSDTGWAVGAEESDFEGWAFPFPGVTLIEDFVTQEEEAEMVQLMDREPWKLSQSGRRKQVGQPQLGRRGGPGWLVREDSPRWAPQTPCPACFCSLSSQYLSLWPQHLKATRGVSSPVPEVWAARGVVHGVCWRKGHRQACPVQLPHQTPQT